VIRAATEADLPEIVRVTNAAYVVEAFCIRGDRTDLAESGARMATGTFFVAEEEGRLLGSVYASQPEPRRAYLGTLAVDPSAQGRGLSKALIAAVEAWAQDRGCAFLDLTMVNLRAELFPFYRNLGFAPIDTLPFPVPDKLIRPCHLVKMTKALLPDDQL
jgi:GNAT superfamily N-acetyltransferase